MCTTHSDIYTCRNNLYLRLLGDHLFYFQAELDLAVSMWDNHTIRPSSNSNSPSGQPRQMFNHPSLWNTRDYLCPVSRTDIDARLAEVEPRSSICCHAYVYDICINIMRENNLVPPFNADEAVVLYRRLRANIDTDLNIWFCKQRQTCMHALT